MRAKGTITTTEAATATAISTLPRFDQRKAGTMSTSEVGFTIKPTASATIDQPRWSRRRASQPTIPAIM